MKTLLLSLLIALSSFVQNLYAANGANLIGITPQSQSMGGTGVALSLSTADAIHRNPANLLSITKQEQPWSLEVSGGLSKLSSTADGGAGSKDGLATSAFTPTLAAGYRLNDQWALGFIFAAHAGAAFDYTGEASLSDLKSNLSQIRIGPAVSYQIVERVWAGVSPFLEYGEFELNNSSVLSPQSKRRSHGASAVGVQLGVTAKPVDQVVVGASYRLKTALGFKDATNLDVFGPNVAETSEDKVDIARPGELAVGVAYSPNDAWTFTADYRWIAWSSSEGHRELGWNDQHVIAIASQYTLDRWKFRAGFNYAKSPLRSAYDENGAAIVDFQGHEVYQTNLSKLNVICFAGIAESHFTLGTGYDVTDSLSLDLGFTLAPRVTVSRTGTSDPVTIASGLGGTYQFVSTFSTWSAALGASYRF